MSDEVKTLLRLFVVYPLAAAMIWHAAVYAVTGRLPSIDWSGAEEECGAGPLKWDC